jgi:hypothetical protein
MYSASYSSSYYKLLGVIVIAWDQGFMAVIRPNVARGQGRFTFPGNRAIIIIYPTWLAKSHAP